LAPAHSFHFRVGWYRGARGGDGRLDEQGALMYHASTLSGLGAVRLPFSGTTGSGAASLSAADLTADARNLPQNCSNGGGAIPRDLPADGETCFMAQFPFIGRKVYGCASMVAEGGFGDPYVGCEPVILKGGGGFDFFTPLAASAQLLHARLFFSDWCEGAKCTTLLHDTRLRRCRARCPMASSSGLLSYWACRRGGLYGRGGNWHGRNYSRDGSGARGPVIGAAIVGVTILVTVLLRSGCGQTCVVTSQWANEAEPLLSKNVLAYFETPAPRTRSQQNAALNNFDVVWAALQQRCSQGGLGVAGQNCIADRQAGACKWRQRADSPLLSIPGQPQTGACWNWFSGYRDPIANDPNVVDDRSPFSQAGAAVESFFGGPGGAPGPGGISPLMLAVGLGLIVAAGVALA
jgi:hypothetical protein